MPEYVIAAYRPKPGQEAELLACVRDHHPILRKEGLVTGREVTVLRAPDGVIVEIFEWKSKEAIEAAHKNAAVMVLWNRFSACSTFATLAELPGAAKPFPTFEFVAL